MVKKTFTINGFPFEFSDEDVKQAATVVGSGTTNRVKLYAKVEDQLYRIRQLVIEMTRQKGRPMPEITAHQAIRVVRALGFEIVEV